MAVQCNPLPQYSGNYDQACHMEIADVVFECRMRCCMSVWNSVGREINFE